MRVRTLLITLALSAWSSLAHAEPVRMDLDLHRASLANVVRLLAEVGGVNVVLANALPEQVSLIMHRVTWREALEAVLAAYGYEMVNSGGVYLIVTHEQAARGRTTEIHGRTQRDAVRPKRLRTRRVSHARAASLAPILRASLPDGATVEVDERTNTLIIRD